MIYRRNRQSSVGAMSRVAQVSRSFYPNGVYAKARERNRFVRLDSTDIRKSTGLLTQPTLMDLFLLAT
jgi:hypothetical protein